MQKNRINPNATFFFDEGSLSVFVPESQKTFQFFDNQYINRIMDIGLQKNILFNQEKIDADLSTSKIIIDKAEYNDWSGDKISLISHLSSRITSDNYPVQNEDVVISNLMELSENLNDVPERYYPSAFIECISLPEPNSDFIRKHNLEDVFLKRKTSRNFEKNNLTLEELSTLLYYSFGFIHNEVWEEFEENNLVSFEARRATPSSTGLQACDVFLTVFNIEKISPGYYFYDSKNHTLLLLNIGNSYDELVHLVADQFWVNNISVGFFIASDLRRIWAKDINNRGYLCSYLDVGHISQTLLLCATAMNIHTWITGTFRDDELCKKLLIDKCYMVPSFFIGLGNGSNNSIPKKLLQKL